MRQRHFEVIQTLLDSTNSWPHHGVDVIPQKCKVTDCGFNFYLGLERNFRDSLEDGCFEVGEPLIELVEEILYSLRRLAGTGG